MASSYQRGIPSTNLSRSPCEQLLFQKCLSNLRNHPLPSFEVPTISTVGFGSSKGHRSTSNKWHDRHVYIYILWYLYHLFTGYKIWINLALRHTWGAILTSTHVLPGRSTLTLRPCDMARPTLQSRWSCWSRFPGLLEDPPTLGCFQMWHSITLDLEIHLPDECSYSCRMPIGVEMFEPACAAQQWRLHRPGLTAVRCLQGPGLNTCCRWVKPDPATESPVEKDGREAKNGAPTVPCLPWDAKMERNWYTVLVFGLYSCFPISIRKQATLTRCLSQGQSYEVLPLWTRHEMEKAQQQIQHWLCKYHLLVPSFTYLKCTAYVYSCLYTQMPTVSHYTTYHQQRW